MNTCTPMNEAIGEGIKQRRGGGRGSPLPFYLS